MSVCPKCKVKLKYRVIENIFRGKANKLKCNICNIEIKITKKTNKINSIIASLLLFLLVFYGHDIINFITNFTENDSVSQCILICIVAVWGMIIYNGNFPWSEYEEVK
ncbi:hypothetical protein [Clostridium sp. D53t1_180928_C8]|uniref:hypothetical protein n=1 Tax=Clostridium sp. D53t1_180928_C8 TaxID=2787101 RepID=UPI0018A9A115|nr:hypothetical protein [Clostridium sp. D53t1_180928_C8]